MPTARRATSVSSDGPTGSSPADPSPGGTATSEALVVPSSAIARYVAKATGTVGICQLPSIPVGTVASVSHGVAPPATRRWTVTVCAPPGRTWPQATLSPKSTQIGSSKWARAGFGSPLTSWSPDCQPVYFRPSSAGSSCHRYWASTTTRGSCQAMYAACWR